MAQGVRMIRDYVRFCVLVVRQRFEIIHLNPSLDLASWPRDIVYLFLAWALAPQTRLLIFYRGWNWEAFEAYQRNPIAALAMRLAHRRAGRILVLSESFRQALLKTGLPDHKVATSTTFFDEVDLSAAIEGVSTDPAAVLFLSRFVPAKGGHLVLDAFARISARFPLATLVMAGDGPERRNLETQAGQLGISERVRFTGYLTSHQKMNVLARSGLFVLPTLHPEGMPNALLEAMASGAAVIASPVGGIPEVVEDGLNGTLLINCDAESLAQAMTTFLGNPALTQAVGRNNRDKAWALWRSDLVASKVEAEYRDLLPVSHAGGRP
jgi:glycosyltransferase involved in cell wall biosynthesis